MQSNFVPSHPIVISSVGSNVNLKSKKVLFPFEKKSNNFKFIKSNKFDILYGNEEIFNIDLNYCHYEYGCGCGYGSDYSFDFDLNDIIWGVGLRSMIGKSWADECGC